MEGQHRPSVATVAAGPDGRRMYAAMPVPACTPEQIAARDAALLAEAERVRSFCEEQERAREEGEAAEARAAQERDLQRGRQAGERRPTQVRKRLRERRDYSLVFVPSHVG